MSVHSHRSVHSSVLYDPLPFVTQDNLRKDSEVQGTERSPTSLKSKNYSKDVEVEELSRTRVVFREVKVVEGLRTEESG